MSSKDSANHDTDPFEETATAGLGPVEATAETVGVHTDLARQAIQQRLFAIGSATKIGRFTVGRKLGAGAMGVVYLARDSELDRDVAIKLLQRHSDASGPGNSWNLTLAEGRALAKLRHPNVVTVHELGEHAGAPYVVMEYLDGGSLRDWVNREDNSGRSRGEIVRALIEVGRGLAAVHAVGLVHRDVKPDNVLVTSDGRAVLADFGLVERTEPGADGERRGLAGTPAYLAAEVWAGGTVEARTDQFAFGVMAWELLCGARPFVGSTSAELARSITASAFQERERIERLPRHLRRAILRMLAPDPSARFPDMAAAVHAIEIDPRRRAVGATVVVGTAVGLIALGWAQGELTVVESDPCANAAEQISTVWNPEVDARLAAHFASSSSSIGGDQWQRTRTRIDAWTASHSEVVVEVCESAQAFGAAGAETLAPKLECLERGTLEFRALLSGLEHVDADEAMLRGVSVIAQLPDSSDCRTAESRDTGRAAVAPELRADADQRLAELRASHRLRNDANTKTLADEVRAFAIEHGLAEAEIEALLIRAKLHDSDGEGAKAAEGFEQALALASAIGDQPRQLEAWIGLLTVHGYGAANIERARLAASLGDRLVERPEFAVPRLHARYLDVRGHFELARGDLELGQQTIAKSLAAAKQAFAPDDPELGRFWLSWGTSLWAVGEPQPALAAFDAARAQFSATLGDQHPWTLAARQNRANVLTSLRRLDEGRAEHEAVRDIRIAVHGVDHVEVADSETGLASVEFAADQPERALEHLLAAVAIYDQRLGPAHTRTLLTRGNIALVYADLDRHEEALAMAQESVKARTEHLGGDHPDIVSELELVASELWALGRLAEAEQQYLRAIEIGARVLPSEHVDLASARQGYATFLLEARRLPEARVHAELALRAKEQSYGEESVRLESVLETLEVIAEGQGRGGEAKGIRARIGSLVTGE